MKYFLLLCCFILISSCFSTKYTANRDAGNFERLQSGKTYVFFNENNSSTKMEIVSIEKDSIIGLKNKNRIALAKKNILNVDQNNTAGTAILAGSLVGTAVLIGVLIANFLDGAAKVGNAIGGQ